MSRRMKASRADRKKLRAKSTASVPSTAPATVSTRLVQRTKIADGAKLGLFVLVKDGALIRGVTKQDHQSVTLTFIREAEGKTPSYSYHGRTGTVDRNDDTFSGDWIGSITAFVSIHSRVRTLIQTMICDQYKIPNTVADLEKFIASRPEGRKNWYTVGITDPKTNETENGGICLPYLMSWLMAADDAAKDSPDEAFISNVTVAPHHQKKGYGTLLHLFLAQYLRDEGFKGLTSDVVGMNTPEELAVWEKLQKSGRDIEKLKPMSHICVPRMLRGRVLDDGMYKILNNRCSSHFGGHEHTLGELEEIDFPQYTWDLSQPIFGEAKTESAAA